MCIKGKVCETIKPAFMVEEYKEYEATEVRKQNSGEIEKYMSER